MKLKFVQYVTAQGTPCTGHLVRIYLIRNL